MGLKAYGPKGNIQAHCLFDKADILVNNFDGATCARLILVSVDLFNTFCNGAQMNK